MRLSRIAVFAALIFGTGAFLFSQTIPNLENGFKPYGSYHGGNTDTTNLLNGNLILHIPMPYSYPQRGGQINPETLLTISSKQWMLDCHDVGPNGEQFCQWDNGPVFNVPANAGIGVDFGLTSNMALARVWQSQTIPGLSVVVSATDYILYTADGASHAMVDGPTDPTTGHELSLDEYAPSAYHVDFTAWDDTQNGVPTAGIVIDRQGNRYPFGNFGGPCSFYMDNANNMSVTTCNQAAYLNASWLGVQATDPNGNNFGGTTDTMGRPSSSAVQAFASLTATSDLSGCVNANSAKVFSYLTFSGASNQIKKCYGSVAINTQFSQTPANKQVSGTISMLTTVVLPDGTNWNFQYDNYGNVTRIGLPLGGSVSYLWEEIAQPLCGSNTAVSRAVKSRTETDNNGHSYTWNYSWGTDVNGTITNVVNEPPGNDTVHVFTNLGQANVATGPCLYYETSTLHYQGPQSNGKLLRRVDTQYSVVSPQAVVPLSIQTTVYPSGKVSLLTKTYSGATVATKVFGNVAAEKQYDWGQNGPGPLLREIDHTYQWEVNPAYLTARMLDLPASVVIKDGSGNRIAETDYFYDETGLQPHTGTLPTGTLVAAPNPSPVRGNLTTVKKWLNTTNSFVPSQTKWYDTGEPYQQVDPLGHTTTFTYDSAYAGAYVTQTCSPQTGSTTHCVSGTYDFTTGLLTSLTNENASTQASGNTPGDDAHTSNYTYDSMSRITLAQAPPDPSNSGARARNIFTYPAIPPTFPYAVTRQKSVTTGTMDSSTTTFDGLGRAFQSQHVLPNGTATVDTTFDLAGHPATVSNPYFTTSEPTYGTTTNAYDGLDRVTQTTKQDGSISKVAYNVSTSIAVNGDCTQTTDEAGKQRGACSDALGRLVEVDEPSGAPVQANYHALMQQDGNFVVLNSAGSSQWSTGSGATNASSIFMQDDGNLVTYIFKWQAGVYAAPTPGSYPVSSCSIGTYLVAGEVLPSGKCIVSPHGQYFLLMNTDGNFFIYDWAHGTGTWGPGTQGHPGAYAIFQTDGNLVVYSASGVALWSSGTSGTYAERLDLNDDGRIIIWKSAWNSGTSDGQFNGTTYAHPSCDVGLGTGTTGLLWSGQCFVSPNGRFELLMQADGNLVIYDRSVTPSAAIWSTGTAVSPVDPSVAYRTLYFYDALGNLTCVEQHGDATSGTGCSAAPSSDATSPWRVRRFTYDSFSRLLTAKNPESGTISYTYDNDGNLLQKTSPAPNQTGTATQTVSHCYDELHRVTGKGYGAQSCPLATPVVTYAYDSGANAKGHLTSLTDQAGTASYTYDILGRLTTETRTLTGANNATIPKTVSYEYNLDGSLYKLHYPSGNVVTYTPDSAGRTLSAVDSGSGINYVTSATYGPDSALTGFVSGNSPSFTGITNSFAYNKRLQPLNMAATAPSQTVFSIGYDFHAGNGTANSGTDNGNVYGIINYKDTTHGRDQSFTYDLLNRLVTAQNAGTDCNAKVLQNKTEYWGNSYAYDAWGNLLQKTITKCGAEHLSVTADAHNWIHSTAPDYQYDAAGNMTYDATAGLGYTFDQENRLTGAAGYTYTYDADGNRVRKSNGDPAANGTLYWYMTPGVVAESDLAGTLKSEYVFFDGERVARKDFPGNAVAYYFSDHLKTASVITDAAGNIKAESDYYPWGGEFQFVNNDSNDYKFTGKKRDTETGLDYFGARYYSNGLGRWVSADWSATPVPVPYASFGDPQSLNQYSYARNLPTTKADADGHCPDVCPLDGPKSLADLDRQNQINKDNMIGLGKSVVNFEPALMNTFITLGESSDGPIPLLKPSNETQETAMIAGSIVTTVITSVFGQTEVGAKAPAPAPAPAEGANGVPESIPAGPSAKPTAAQQKAINEMGDAHGCHTCGAKTPGTKSGNWVGDHQPETALNTSGKPQVYKPQCLTCSRRQGGLVRAAQAKAAAAARKQKQDQTQ